MDLEFHQLDLRYEPLRSRSPAREQRLLSSLAEVGQQTPIVVVSAAQVEKSVVIDGYKRVRLLRKLGQDTVTATAWALEEVDALLLDRKMRTADADSAPRAGVVSARAARPIPFRAVPCWPSGWSGPRAG